MSDSLIILESLSKTSKSLLFPFFILKSESLALLFAQSLFFKKSDHERIAPVAHYKRATMSEFPTLLYSLLTVEDFNLSIKLHVPYCISFPSFNVQYILRKIRNLYKSERWFLLTARLRGIFLMSSLKGKTGINV